MARHTFVVSGGSRIEIQPSKVDAGAVLISILHSSGDLIGCVTTDAPTAAVIAQALELEAGAAETRAENTRARNESNERAEKAARRYEEKARNESRPIVKSGWIECAERARLLVLPVVDVAQVGA
jgi:hypothetical protein